MILGFVFSSNANFARYVKTQLATAQASKDPALAGPQAKYDAVSTARVTVFEGEMLRNA